MKNVKKGLLLLLALGAIFLAGCSDAFVVEQEEMTKAEKAAPLDNGSKTVYYWESLVNGSTPDSYEPDNGFNSCTLLDISESSSSTYHNFVDNAYDWVKFDVVAGQRVLMESSLGIQGQADTVFTLIDHQGNLLASNDDGGYGWASKIVYIFPKAGRYFLQIKNYNGKTGSNTPYSLLVC